MTEYCIFLDPNRPPQDGTFVTFWQDSNRSNRNTEARQALSLEVAQWCTATLGPHCPDNLMERRWTRYVNNSWKIHRPADILLFKLRWCHPVSWMRPAKYTAERARANRAAWKDFDGYQW